MVLPLIPLIYVGVAAGSAFVAGMASRQPEISRLRKQVELLQGEIARLHRVIEEQQRQIRELTLRFKTLSAINFIEKRRVKGITRGFIIFQYAFREYIELLIAQNSEKNISERQKIFFNCFNLIVSGGEITNDGALFVKDYVNEIYKYQIDNLIPLSADDEAKLISAVEAA